MQAIDNTALSIREDQFMFSASFGTVTGKKLATTAVMTYPSASVLHGMAILPSER